MKIAFTGYYGFSNYGDDLFTVVCPWAAHEYWSQQHISVIGTPVKGANANFSMPSFFPQNWYSSMGFIGKMSRLTSMASAIVSNDMIIMAGGSTLSSFGSNNTQKMLDIASGRRAISLAGIGLSIGPFHSSADEKKCEEFLKRFIYLAVRDQDSYNFTKSMNLPFEPVRARDLVGMLPLAADIETEQAEQSRPLGVALCNYESYVSGNLEIERQRNDVLFQGILAFAKDKSISVRIFSLNTNPITGDDELVNRLAHSLNVAGIKNDIVRTNDGVWNVWQKIRQCSALLSVRLHGGISAYLAGVPFCLIEYHKKCKDFSDDVGQHPSLRLSGEVSSPEEVKSVLEQLINNPISPMLDPKRYIEESKLNFTAAPWATSARNI